MADLVTRLLLDNKQFDNNIIESARQLQHFQKIGKNIVGMLGRFAGGLGIAMGASEAFTRVIRGSQTTSDAFDSTMRACESSVNNFFTAISTGDFTAFDNGITAMINKAKEAYAAMDALGNAVISFDYLSGKNMSEFNKQMTIAKDKTKSKEERDAALKAAKATRDTQEEYVKNLKEKSINAAKALSTESSGFLKSSDIRVADIDRIFELDITSKGEAQKASLEKQYNDFLKKYNALVDTNTTSTTTVDAAGFPTTFHETDKAAVNKGLEGLKKEFKDALLYKELLVKKNDDALKELASILTKAESANMGISSMDNTLNRQDYQINYSNPSNTNNKENKQVIEETQKEIDMTPIFIPIKFDSEKSLAELEFDRKQIVKRLNNSQTPEDYVKIKAELDAKDAQISDFKSGKGKGISKPIIEIKPIENNKIENKFKESIKWANDYATALNSVAQAVSAVNSTPLEDNSQGWTQWSTQFLSQAAAVIATYYSLAMAAGTKNAMDWPFPANLGILASLTAAIISVFASLPSFSEGGIFTGLSDYGDMNIARVNAGEMILNNRQQRNLFNLLNGSSFASSQSGQVEFKIKGKELIGVLSNYNNKMRKI